MIGLWICRFTESREPRMLTLWHRVESEIADRKVTTCGRQMGEIAKTVLAPLVTPPSFHVTCQLCNPNAA